MARKNLKPETSEKVLKCVPNHSQEQINNLCTIPGISRFAASLITHYFDPSLSIKAWIAYVGLDVSVSQSGKWRSQGKISKRGKPYFRKRLYNCAWGAMMQDSDFRNYYDLLKHKGRKHTEILMIIARKQLGIAHSVVKNNSVYYDYYWKNRNLV